MIELRCERFRYNTSNKFELKNGSVVKCTIDNITPLISFHLDGKLVASTADLDIIDVDHSNIKFGIYSFHTDNVIEVLNVSTKSTVDVNDERVKCPNEHSQTDCHIS